MDEAAFIDSLGCDKLDEEFSRTMDQLADRRDEEQRREMDDELCRCPSLWRNLMQVLQINGHRGKYFLCLLGQLSDVDVYSGYQAVGATLTKDAWRRHKCLQNFDERYNSTGKLTVLRRLVRLIYYFSAASLFINSLFQYQYDYHYTRQQIFLAIVRPGSNTINVDQHLQNYAHCPLIWTLRLLKLHRARAEALKRDGAIMQLEMYNSTSKSSSIALDKLEVYMNDKVRALREFLDIIGAPYVALRFLIEIIYLFLISSVMFVYDFMPIYHQIAMPFDISLLRAILDWKHERRVINHIIRHEINRFIYSSKNYLHVQLKQAKVYLRELHSDSIEALGGAGASGAARLLNQEQQMVHRVKKKLKKYLMNHVYSCRMLKQMALEGKFMPANRNAKHIRSLSERVILFCLIFMGYAYGTALLLAFGFFIFTGYDIDTSFNHILVIAEAGVVVLILVAVGAFYASLLSANCYDQIQYVDDTKSRIINCITSNEHQFVQCLIMQERSRGRGQVGKYDKRVSELPMKQQHQMEQVIKETERVQSFLDQFSPAEWPARPGLSRKSNWSLKDHSMAVLIDSHHTQMNQNLLEVLMHYKIFIAQLRPIMDSFGPFSFGCLVLMVTLPLSLRVHVNYLETAFKLYAMFFCLILASVSDIVLMPLCYMNCRCREMYKLLNSLLAHVLEVSQSCQMRGHKESAKRAELLKSRSSNRPASPRHSRSLANGAGERMASASLDSIWTSKDNWPRSDNEAIKSERDIYDSHTVWLLRKELDHSHRMDNQFAIYAFGIIRLSYENLLRLHFWVSLLSLSMIVQSASIVEQPVAAGQSASGRANAQRELLSPSEVNKVAAIIANQPLSLVQRNKLKRIESQVRQQHVRQQEFFSSILSDPFGVFEL